MYNNLKTDFKVLLIVLYIIGLIIIASVMVMPKTYYYDGVYWTVEDIDLRISQREFILAIVEMKIQEDGADPYLKERLSYAQHYLDSLQTIRKELLK